MIFLKLYSDILFSFYKIRVVEVVLHNNTCSSFVKDARGLRARAQQNHKKIGTYSAHTLQKVCMRFEIMAICGSLMLLFQETLWVYSQNYLN